MHFSLDALAIYVGALVANAIYAFSTALVARWHGLSPKEVKVGFGPGVNYRRGDTTYSLRPIPLSSAVSFRNEEDGTEGEFLRWKLYYDLPYTSKCLILSAGPVVMTAVGLMGAFTHLSRFALAMSLIVLWFGLANFVPVPIQNGGLIVLEALPSAKYRRLPGDLSGFTILASILILLAIQITVGVLLYRYWEIVLSWFLGSTPPN